MAARTKKYDDGLLVELLARGELNYGQIAKKVGISEAFVNQIARGDRRPELQDRIVAAVEGFRLRAKRRGAAMAEGAMDALGKMLATRRVKCPACKGKGTQKGKRQKIRCPSCRGTGKVATTDVPPETRRRAAVDILNHAIGDPSRPEVNVTQQQQTTPGLTPDLLKKVAKVKGGPKV